MPRFRRLWRVLLIIAIFFSTYVVRAYHPISRSPWWIQRSQSYTEAIREQNWRGTYISRHPGFTTMVVGGISLQAYDALKDTAPFNAFYDWIFPQYATDLGRHIMAGVAGLSLIIALAVTLSMLALKQISGWRLAAVAGGLLAFAPYFVAHSQDFHVDGMLCSLMLLSGLLSLAYGQLRRRRYLILSGLVAGFAVLTKSPALFLFPFTGLTLLAYLVIKLRAGWSDHAEGRAAWILHESWRDLAAPLLVWLGMMILPFALWPVMWVAPKETLVDLFFKTEERVINPHPGPRFLFGQVYNTERPLFIFYVVTFLLKSSFVTLTLAILALLQRTIWRRRIRGPVTATTFWLMIAYVIFFMLEMTIGAKQAARYILPSHVMVEVIAAIGAVGMVNLLVDGLPDRWRNAAWAVPLLAVIFQGANGLFYAPHFSAHHNALLGGSRVAQSAIELMEMNEGSYYVGNYLAQVHVQDAAIPNGAYQLALNNFVDIDFERQTADPTMDYVMFIFGDFQRDDHREYWLERWRSVRDLPPDLTVEYDGVTYVWVYAGAVPPRAAPIVIKRDGIGFVILAWVWFVALITGSIVMLRRGSRETS